MKSTRTYPAFPAFWQLQICGWLGFTLLVVLACLTYPRREVLIDNLIWCGLMFLVSFALRPICRELARRSKSWIALESWAFAASLVLGSAGALAFAFIVSAKGHVVWDDFFINILQFAIVLFLWCTLYFSIKNWQQVTAERERLLRLQSESREARLRALRYQLNPHFLSNALNAVSTLILDGNAQAATRTLAQISDLLRNTLDGDPLAEVPLAAEIDLARQYLSIEQARFGERLRVRWEIAPETLGQYVPSMLLQPLLENAVVHGIAQQPEPGEITVRSIARRDRLAITVTNPVALVAQREPEHVGVGLQNTAERLTSLYGDEQRFTARRLDGAFEVTVELPMSKPASIEPVVCAS